MYRCTPTTRSINFGAFPLHQASLDRQPGTLGQQLSDVLGTSDLQHFFTETQTNYLQIRKPAHNTHLTQTKLSRPAPTRSYQPHTDPDTLRHPANIFRADQTLMIYIISQIKHTLHTRHSKCGPSNPKTSSPTGSPQHSYPTRPSAPDPNTLSVPNA